MTTVETTTVLFFNPNSEKSNNGKLGPYLPNNFELIEYEI
jgi:hypothetical protein